MKCEDDFEAELAAVIVDVLGRLGLSREHIPTLTIGHVSEGFAAEYQREIQEICFDPDGARGTWLEHVFVHELAHFFVGAYGHGVPFYRALIGLSRQAGLDLDQVKQAEANNYTVQHASDGGLFCLWWWVAGWLKPWYLPLFFAAIMAALLFHFS
ncbi:MAG: hypothetical protein PHR30_08505 [Gallionellaceae bacterium]|nr:hypothetical protein [Gallionellaceae bacterium]